MKHILAALALLAIPSFADTEVVDGIEWTYTVSDGTARIGNGFGNAIPDSTTGAVAIPSTLGGCPVTDLAGEAFSGCSGVTSVEIPDGIAELSFGTFSGCSGLASVSIPASVERINRSAFMRCPALAAFAVDPGNRFYASRNGLLLSKDGRILVHGVGGNVKVPDGVEAIDESAFSECTGLTGVQLPDGVKDIGSFAFYGCSQLASLSVPAGVTNIGSRAFFGCPDALFDTTTIPGVRMLDGWAVDLQAVHPAAIDLSGVRGMDDRMFANDRSIVSVVLPAFVGSIGDTMFWDCSALESVTIPAGVTNIARSAFNGCSKLESVSIPSGVASIGEQAFRKCSSLQSVVIPDGVEIVESGAFEGCSGLASVSIPYALKNSAAEWGLSDTCEVVVRDPLPFAIATDATLPVAPTRIGYRQPLEATGGLGPYTWDFADGSDRPYWLSLVSSTQDPYRSWLSGWPGDDAIGTYVLLLRATDSEGRTAERAFTLVVAENANHPPEVATEEPPYGAVVAPGETIRLTAVASDPDGDGLSFRWSGYGPGGCKPRLEGGESVEFRHSRPGRYIVTVEVSDGMFQRSAQWYIWVGDLEPLAIATRSILPTAQEGVPWYARIEVAGGAPESWAPRWSVRGTLPAGVSGPYYDDHAWSRFLEGTPEEGSAGVYSFDICAEDEFGRTATRTFTLVVADADGTAPLEIVTDSVLPAAMEGVPWYARIQAAGGTGGCRRWTVRGALPAGADRLSYDDHEWSRYIEGPPLEGTAGTYSFDVSVEDGSGQTATKTFTVVVEDNPNRSPWIRSASPSRDDGVLWLAPGQSETFDVSAVDPDGRPLVFDWQLTRASDWETLATNQTAGSRSTFVFPPMEASDDEYTVRCVVRDDPWYLILTWSVRVRPPLEIATAGVPDAIEMEDYDVRLAATNAQGEVRWSVDATPYSVRREPNSFRETGTPILGAGSDRDWGEFFDKDGWTTEFALPFPFPVGTQTVDSVRVSIDGVLDLPDLPWPDDYVTADAEDPPDDDSPHRLPESLHSTIDTSSDSFSPYPFWNWDPRSSSYHSGAWERARWASPCRFHADATRTTVFVDASVPGAVTFRWSGVGSSGWTYGFSDGSSHYYETTDVPAPFDFSATLYSDGTIRFSYGPGNYQARWLIDWISYSGLCSVAGQNFGNLFLKTGMSHAEDIVLTPRTVSYPPGTSLSEDGVLSGRPWKAGTYAFDVVAEDSNQRTSRTFSFVVGENPDRPPVVESFSPEWGECIMLPEYSFLSFSRASTSSGTNAVVGTSSWVDAISWTVGETKTFAVSARDPEGQPLSYVWRVNGEMAEGETSPTFSYTASVADLRTNEWGDVQYLTVACIVSDGTWSELIGWRFNAEGPPPSQATTWFVDAASTCAEPDGRSWNTAFATLAQADGAAQFGDTVLVAPGVYSSAGCVIEYWTMTNTMTQSGWMQEEARIVETNAISFAGVELRSTGGPDVTVIDGEGARPCFDRRYQSGGTLVGFTLRNSASMHLSGCRIERCVVSNCVFRSTPFSECELVDCTIVANRSDANSHAPLLYGCLLDNCVVTANETEEFGILRRCNLFHCTVAENTVRADGTAALDAECRAYNTIVWNNRGPDGGILNYQTVPSYVDADGTVVPAQSATFENCCLNEYHEDKPGLVFDDPMLAGPLAGDARLRAGSSCIDAGSEEWVYVDSDIAGRPRIAGAAPDIGAWEGAAASGHSVSVRVRGRGSVSPVSVLVRNGGSATFSATETVRPFRGFYDESGSLLSPSLRWTLRNVRSDRSLVAVFESALYADAENGDDANDGFSRETAKRTIQAAVDAALEGETVFVAPGVYGPFRTDGRKIRIVGEEGAARTIVDGGGTNRCATLVDPEDWLWYVRLENSTLVGLTLRNGFGDRGGGACGGVLVDCAVSGNRATEAGGGLFRTTAEQCTILGNEVRPDGAPAEEGFRRLYGGGAAECRLANCLVVGNAVRTLSANDRAMGGGVYGDWTVADYCTVAGNRIDGPGLGRGSGVFNGWVRGCIVSGNDLDGIPADAWGGTEPIGYLTVFSTYVGDDPGFVDAAGGDYRLREDSPCVDAGALPAGAEEAGPGELDLDGNPRVLGAAVDQGCYESAGGVRRFVHRFYSKNYKGHFFTIDEEEKDDLVAHNPNWKYEGVAYRAFTGRAQGTTALHRFYSKSYRGHFFTIDEEEKDGLIANNPNWRYEGVAYYVYPQAVEGSVPVFRFWSKKYRHHFYTVDEAEKDSLIATNPNWKYEGVAFHALPATEESAAQDAQFAAQDADVAMAKADTAMADADAESRNASRATRKTERTEPNAMQAATNADGAAQNAAQAMPDAEWTLRAEVEKPAGRVAIATPGVTEVGDVLVETREDVPDEAELESPAGSAEAVRSLRLALPSGRWSAALWSARDGIVAEKAAEGAFDFDLPVSGVWHRLRIRDAADEDSGDAFSLWLRAE